MKRIMYLGASLFVATGLVVVASPAYGATSVSNWSDLQSAFSSAPSGTTTTIQLGADISTAASGTSSLFVPDNGGSGGATIILDLNGHHLTIPANTVGDAGIGVYQGATLTIEDTAGGGVLDVTGADYASAIGVSYAQSNGQTPVGGGTITIDSGTVNATGGVNGSGLGGAYYFGGGTITINGGTVTATGGGSSSAIGNGYWQRGDGPNSEATSIAITGGSVTAIGGNTDGLGDPGGPGIGLGLGTDGTVQPMPTISISGCANVTASGGSSGTFGGGAAAIGAAPDNTYSPALTIDGVAPAGAPTTAGSGQALDGSNPGGVGSAITYSGTATNQLSVTATTPSTAAAGGTFSLTCTHVDPTTTTTTSSATPAKLASTGFDGSMMLAPGLGLGVVGMIVLTLRRRRSVSL